MLQRAAVQQAFIKLPPKGLSRTFVFGSPHAGKHDGLVAESKVSVMPFKLQTTPVTFGQYMQFLEDRIGYGKWMRFIYSQDGQVDDGNPDPEHNFAKVVWVPRPGPQPCVDEFVFVIGISFELALLPVGNHFEAKTEKPNQEANQRKNP